MWRHDLFSNNYFYLYISPYLADTFVSEQENLQNVFDISSVLCAPSATVTVRLPHQNRQSFSYMCQWYRLVFRRWFLFPLLIVLLHFHVLLLELLLFLVLLR